MALTLLQGGSADCTQVGWRMANRSLLIGAAMGGLLVLEACQSAPVEKIAAQPSPERLEYVVQFKKIDTAGKGLITLDQATVYYTGVFNQLDRNHSGFLDANELQALVPVMGAKSGADLLTVLDRNADNKVSKAEFLTIVNWLFQMASSPETLTLAQVESNLPVASRTTKPPALFGNH
jgi:EF hand